MAWPTGNYRFLDLSQADKQARRQTLERYALYAQLSALVPVALVLLYRAAWWAARSRLLRAPKGDYYDAIPSSPVLKQRQSSNVGAWGVRAGRARWWLGGEVMLGGMHLGQRDRMCLIINSIHLFCSAKLTCGEQSGWWASHGLHGSCCSVCWRRARVSLAC
jgi:hypothetical protein